MSLTVTRLTVPVWQRTLLAVAMGVMGTHAYANTDVPVSEARDTTQNLQYEQKTLDNLQRQNAVETQIKQSEQALQESAADEVVAPRQIDISADASVDELYAYLEQDPSAFETLLLRSIAEQNTQALQALLPAYERYPNKDQSVIDWGHALLALRLGDTKKAVQLYREINAALPDIRLLRLQMASALYQNRQINAAKDELEKLLREDITERDRAEINSYIAAINRLDKWNYSFNLSFARDTNLEDAAPVGTKMSDQNSSLVATTPHESGTGFSYNLGVDKKWSYDNHLFNSFSTGLSGTHYWNNKKYDDMYLSASVGLGYQAATGEIEIAPNVARSWYGGGTGDTRDGGRLKSYTQSQGVRLSGSKWLNSNLMYQHNTQFSKVSYEKPYQSNDGKVYSMTNGFFYAPNAKQYYLLNWNISKKDGTDPSKSYKRSGVNVSWNNTWPMGFTTLATVGIASKKYEGVNFVDIKRHNHEYNLGLSVWKRDFSFFGLTPRLNINHKNVDSNFAFDKVSETNANVTLSTTF